MNNKNKTIAKITHVHKTPNLHSDVWYVDVEYTDQTKGRKHPIPNSIFMGLILRLREQDPSLVCQLPQLKHVDVNLI